MGNCFGRPDSPSKANTSGNANNFSTPGRTLGANTSITSSLPQKAQQKAFTGANSPGRRLGSKSDGTGTGTGTGTAPTPLPQTTPASSAGAGMGTAAVGGQQPGSDDPKSAAARAAEERLRAAQGNKGKLGKQLDAQRARTHADTLAQASRETRGQRDADRVQESRAYN